MSLYEVVFIVRPDVATTQVDAITKRITDRIEAGEGRIIKSENWGLRSMAYSIKKHAKGYYTMLCCDMPGNVVAEIEHMMKLSDDVIRFLTIKVDAITDEPSVMLKAKVKADAEAAEFEEMQS